MGNKPVNAIAGKQGFQRTGRSTAGKTPPTVWAAFTAEANVPGPNGSGSYEAAYGKLKASEQNGLREQIREKTVAVREMNGFHDSEFLALVQGQNGGFGWVTTGSTASDSGFIATPDATEEVRAHYRDWWNARKAEADREQADLEDRSLAAGRTVMVDSGREHRGEVGTVTWHGEDQFRSDRHSTHYTARVRTADGVEFLVPTDRLKVKTRDGSWALVAGTVDTHRSPVPRGVAPAAFVLSEYPHPDTV